MYAVGNYTNYNIYNIEVWTGAMYANSHLVWDTSYTCIPCHFIVCIVWHLS